MARHDIFRARGSTRILKITASAAEAFTADASNYHTFTVRHVRGTQTTGELVGTAYSLDTRSLVVNEPVTLYADSAGLAMSDGERLALYLTETGSPSALQGLEVWVEDQQIVR